MRTLVRTEARLFLREPLAVFWGVAFPVVLLAVIGSLGSSREPAKEYGGLRFLDVYVPVLLLFSLGVLALNALPPVLATYRERGVLRRLATTPVGPVRMLSAQLGLHAAVGVVSLVAVLILARAAFSVSLPGEPVAFVLTVVLAGACLLAIGLFLAAVAPTGRTANALGAITFFPMMFFAGLWLPRASMGPGLRHVSDFTPLGAAAGAMQAAVEGGWPRALHFAVLAGWTVLAGGAAIRLFRWQ
jgi:ABC-2 type transport system permease protein